MASDSFINLIFWSNMLVRLQIMIMVGAIIIFFAILLGKKVKRPRPQGVIGFGVLLIFGSLYKLWGFLSYDHYKFMFQQLPSQVVLLRFFFSIVLRLVGLTAATGVLLMKDAFRKLFLLLCLFTLCFIYWKHPFFVFENVSRLTEQQFLNNSGAKVLTYPLHAWISMIFNYAMDIGFSLAALYYFTRTEIKKQFD